MNTAAQQLTITPDHTVSMWVRAARLLPGFRASSIKGDGPYAIRILCRCNRSIHLFPTATARRRFFDRLDRGQCCGTCSGDHFVTDLVELAS